jgi:hypothetical protein
MIDLPTAHRRCRILLAAAAIWLVAVTLCSTGTMAAAHDHDHDSTPAGEHHEDGCGCASFSSFPAQSFASDLAKVPAPAITDALPLGSLEEIPRESGAFSRLIHSTGPPERLSFADLVLQRCRHSHAPPLLT